MILHNLDDGDDIDNIDPDLQMSDEDEDAGMLQELEQRKEEILEEFLEMV